VRGGRIVAAELGFLREGDAMLEEIPSDIKSILRALTFRQMAVSGPERLADKTVYLINGHALTEEELRDLARAQRLTSWEIYNYIRRRAANH
jgi:hypothetical protein